MKHEYADDGKVRVSVVGDDGKTYKSCWGTEIFSGCLIVGAVIVGILVIGGLLVGLFV